MRYSALFGTAALVLLSTSYLVAQTAVRGTEPNVEFPSEGIGLNPGDAVRITVWRKPELSGQFSVSVDGTVANPFYLGVQVAGVPFSVAADRVRSHIERFEAQPMVLVEPLYRVAVIGQVRRPDSFAFGPEVTIAQAVTLAGGLTEAAKPDQVWLLRGNQRMLVDLQQPEVGLAHTSVRSGDYILAERRQNILREYIFPTVGLLGSAASIARFFR